MLAVHMNPRNYKDPLKFEPKRFDPTYPEWFNRPDGEKRTSASFQPFSINIRQCMGQNLAIIQMKSIITSILLLADFEVVESQRNKVILNEISFALFSESTLKIDFKGLKKC